MHFLPKDLSGCPFGYPLFGRIPKKKAVFCELKIAACVEARFVDSSMIPIDCTLVEAEVAGNSLKAKNWIVPQSANLLFTLCKRQSAD